MTTITVLIIGAILIIRNRKLEKQIAIMMEWQTETDNRLNTLNRKSRKQTNKQRMYEQKLWQQRKRQERMEKAQEKIRREQAKQRETISKLSFRLTQAEADIQHQQTRLNQLFALLDVTALNQTGTVPGTAQDFKYQKQIIAIENQIAACEKKIAKAQFDRSQAQEALKAA